MKRIFACTTVVLAGLSLAGCAVIAADFDKAKGTTVSINKADTMVRVANFALDAAADYLTFPVCTGTQSPLINRCKTKKSIQPVEDAIVVVTNSRNALQSAIASAHAQGTAVGVVSTVYQAVVNSKDSLIKALPAGSSTQTSIAAQQT